MRRLRPAGVATALLVMTACTSGGATTTTEPTATSAPTTSASTTSDLGVIEAGVAAFYSGDGERAAALFELPDRTDEEIRQEAAYQAAIDGRLGLDCTESTPGTFSCNIGYGNALIDAAAAGNEDNYIPWLNRRVREGVLEVLEDENVVVVVEDGVIRDFVFPEYATVNVQLGSFLAAEGRLEGYEDCVFGPLTESCAVIQLENLDAWAEWQGAWDGQTEADEAALKARHVDWMNSVLGAWYGGDCLGAHYLAGVMLDNGYRDGANAFCPSSASSSQTIEYESILGAEVTVEACDYAGFFDAVRGFDNIEVYLLQMGLTCTVHYSNAMNTAVGKSPSVTVRDGFLLSNYAGLVMTLHPDDVDWTLDSVPRTRFYPWYAEGVYPEDRELRESFRVFADGGELGDEYAAANCATERTPECANLIMDNLDDWAVWYQERQ